MVRHAWLLTIRISSARSHPRKGNRCDLGLRFGRGAEMLPEDRSVPGLAHVVTILGASTHRTEESVKRNRQHHLTGGLVAISCSRRPCARREGDADHVADR